MLRVGLTGGIACGKSLVAGFFRDRGVPVVDDDQAARDAVVPGSEGLAAVVAEFGSEVLLPDGSLDRVALGRRVFVDPQERAKLMRVTFPHIGRLVAERLAAAERSGAPMVVYESALLIENGVAESWRPLVVVCAARGDQIARLQDRNGLDRDEAEARIRAQLPVERKVALADHVIDNSGSLEDAARRFEHVFAGLLAMKRPPSS